MAKKISFKDPKTTVMHVNGWGKVDKSNLNEDVYNFLVARNPKHKDSFIVEDEKEQPKK